MPATATRSPFRPVLMAAMLLLAMVVAPHAQACQVPVFRYALERWRADAYEILVLHAGPLSAADDERLKGLQVRDVNAQGETNIDVRAMDIAEVTDPEAIKLWDKHSPDKKPLMIVVYPRQAVDVAGPVAWIAPFDDASVKQLVDSPLRREIARRILAGDSAVFVFIPSGDEKQDAAAMAKLKEQLDTNQKQMKLPPPEVIKSDEFFKEETVVELRLGFSIVTLKRDDPAEAFFLQSLLRGERDLEDIGKPIVYPVIGRGRALYALVGDGINDDVIAQACGFIIGPCSCQVKDQNPGFDVVMTVAWDDAINGTAIPQEPLPELTGLSALAPATSDDQDKAGTPDNQRGANGDSSTGTQLADATSASNALPGALTSPGAGASSAPAVPTPTTGVTTDGSPSNVMRNIGIVVAIGLAVVVIGTIAMKRRGAGA